MVNQPTPIKSQENSSMLNDPFNNSEKDDILERLKHPEQRSAHLQKNRNLRLRNTLNIIFILLAIVAMVGIACSFRSEHSMLWYAIGMIAVLVKMVEVVLRMGAAKK